MAQNTTELKVRVPAEDHARLKKVCADHGVTMADAVRASLRRFIVEKAVVQPQPMPEQATTNLVMNTNYGSGAATAAPQEHDPPPEPTHPDPRPRFSETTIRPA